MASRLLSASLVVALAAAGFAGYRLLESQLAAAVYRERIAQLSFDYETLREHYNEAVRRTAVTELRVEDGVLSVAIRTAAGDLRVFPSPYDPTREIYIDYVALEGRLWIRRIFDENTPPGEGMVIDPAFADVDWNRVGEGHGKAAYRSLGEGRWVVDVTGDGSLGLARREEETGLELAPPPPVRHYAPIESEVRDALDAIAPAEAMRALAKRLGI